MYKLCACLNTHTGYIIICINDISYACLDFYVYIYISVCLSVYLTVGLFVCLAIDLSNLNYIYNLIYILQCDLHNLIYIIQSNLICTALYYTVLYNTILNYLCYVYIVHPVLIVHHTYRTHAVYVQRCMCVCCTSIVEHVRVWFWKLTLEGTVCGLPSLWSKRRHKTKEICNNLNNKTISFGTAVIHCASMTYNTNPASIPKW